MAEYIALPFKQFVRDIFFYRTYFPFYLNERDCLHPPLCMQQSKTAVFKMSSAYCPYMRNCVFEQSKNVLLRTDEDLLLFRVPRCLRIFNPQNLETLIVVMSFIHEFLLKRLCAIAYKCLHAVLLRVRQWMPKNRVIFQDHARKNLTKTSSNSSDEATIDRETLRKNKSIIHESLLKRLCSTAYKCLNAVFNRVKQWMPKYWGIFWDHVRRNLNTMHQVFNTITLVLNTMGQVSKMMIQVRKTMTQTRKPMTQTRKTTASS